MNVSTFSSKIGARDSPIDRVRYMKFLVQGSDSDNTFGALMFYLGNSEVSLRTLRRRRYCGIASKRPWLHFWREFTVRVSRG